MRLLAATHWSFGRDRDLLRAFRDVFEFESLTLHDLRSDPDLNRTSVVSSAEEDLLREAILRLAELALPRIDLSRHRGTHERTGALDVCTLIIPQRDPTLLEIETAHAATERLGAGLAAKFHMPVVLTGKVSRRAEADELGVREGGFGSLEAKELAPDFGPQIAHAELGLAMVGLRDYSVHFQIDFEAPNGGLARSLARESIELRAAGDPHFLGVEATSHVLVSRNRERLSVELTLPDLATADPIVEWALDRSARAGFRAFGAELVGAARVSDLPGATRLSIREEQIIG